MKRYTCFTAGYALFLAGVTIFQWALPGLLPQRVILARSLLAVLTVGSLLLGLPPLATVIGLTVLRVTLNRFDGVPTMSMA